ncbi:type IV pilus modification protein PilV [Gammaproteobacteria bacterium LSUCC0112]|nr:type IV pilus modification protein PilV [Gammaproteobacteria bacterium LSUCC0112]
MCKGILPDLTRCGLWRQQQGISLIEVLVTALILGIGVMGMLKLQSYSLVLAHASLQRQTASWQLMDLAERVRSDSEAFRHLDNAFLNSSPFQAAICRSGIHCTREQFAQQLVLDWNHSTAALLPDADVAIYRASAQNKVSWQVSISWFSDAGEMIIGRIVL